MSHFVFLRFGLCLRIKAELILVRVKHKSLKLKHNKRFKRDSQRAAFLLCVGFRDYVLFGKLVVALSAP